MPLLGMDKGTERELSRPRPPSRAGARPLVRRALWIAGTALSFVLLAVLGLGLASLFFFGEASGPEPEPPPVVRPAPRPVPEPAPPPPRPPAPAPVQAPPPAPPVPEPASAEQPVVPSAIPLQVRIKVRQQVLRDIAALKDELARCPSEPVTRSPPTARATVVLDAVAENGAVRVASSRLEADGPVNDRFVSCARSVIEGKRFVVTSVPPGARFRLLIPVGPNGNSLSIPAASLTEAGGKDGD